MIGMVPYREVSTSFTDKWLQPPMEGCTSVGFKMEVELNDEVEAVFRHPNVEVGDYEFDVEGTFGCFPASTLDGHAAEVDGGDLPALFCEPQGVRTLAAGDVECGPGLQVRDDFRELRVGVA